MVLQYWETSSRLESWLLLYKIARAHFRDDYLTRLRLRLPWFVALVDTDRFARLTVTNRLLKTAESMIGPFPSRETAQRYEQELLAAFSLRRCWEELSPAPDHPGCVYGEIKLCSRPCQCAVSESDYRREAGDVKDFLLTNGRSTIKSLALARDQAAAETDFETAARIHKRVEKLETAARSKDAIIAELGSFHGVAVTKGSGENRLRLWPMQAGFWQEPVALEAPGNDSNSTSLESHLRDLLTPAFLHPDHEGQQAEDLAVFARWYYSSWRDGEWFPFTSFDGSTCRRLARRILRMPKEDVTTSSAVSC
jgi:excinuclease ABC subunit C